MIEVFTSSPHSGLRITTLGGLSITHAGAAVTGLASRKAEAMLVYLACTRRPHARDVLADLLWDDVSTTRARGNLSVLLTSLRRQIGAYLQIDRHSVAVDPASPTWSDVVELETLIASALHTQRPRDAKPLSADSTEQVDRALELYRGDFLQGFGVRESAGFEVWMVGEQERLRRLVLAAGEQLVASYLRQRSYGTGLTHATRLLQLDPLHEELHRQIMQLLTFSGQRAAAVAHYETCRRTLDDELGVTPSTETTALYHRIVSGELTEPAASAAGMHDAPIVVQTRPTRRLPRPPTPIVGRDVELEQIAERVADPHCRLLTLLGPGGIGKTRLAIEAAARLQPMFRDGAAFVALAAIDTPDQISATIAAALGCTLSGQHDPADELMSYLRDKHLLLILDNLEQLVDGAGLLDDLTRHAPDVRIVVTSRERLYVRAEWLFDVDGLCFPPAGVDRADVSGYSAVELFTRQARRVQPQFAITDETAASIARICRLVGGTPLAIEMAAAWVRSLPCAEIERKISGTLDFLATALRDVPERHRSMRAVFEQSWHMLSTEERALLCRLSAFHDGWTEDAGAQVAAATPAVLTALIDKSLLRLGADGRYGLHPLLRQFAAEHREATPHEEQRVMQRHSQYFLTAVASNQLALAGREPHVVVQRLQADWDNVRHAWQWSVEHGDAAAIDGSVAALAHLCVLTGRLRDGEALLAVAAETITRWPHHLPTQQTLGRVLAEQAGLLNKCGLHDHALPLAARALELAINTGARDLEAISRFVCGEALLGQSNYATADDHLRTAVLLAEQAGQPGVAARSQRIRGVLTTNMGDYTTAQRLCEDALERFRALGDRRGESLALNNLGVLAEQQGAYATAQSAYQDALAIHRDIGDRHGEGYVLCNLGVVARGQGNYQLAQKVYEQALAIFRATGDRLSEGIALNNLGDITLDQGDHDGAQAYFAQSLAIRTEIGDRLGESYTLASLALLQHHRGDHRTSRETSRAALEQCRAIAARSAEAIALTCLGHALHALGDLDEAHAVYSEAMALHRLLNEQHRTIEALAGLTRVMLARGNAIEAHPYAETILTHIRDHTLCGTDEPIRVYLTCYHTLRANHDPRARDVLEAARNLLVARAEEHVVPTLRRSFTEHVPAHREVLAEYARAQLRRCELC